MTEIHDNPSHAFVDGAQALTPAQFKQLTEGKQGARGH